MIGRRLAHYEVTAKLGEGGMGVVYRARDTRLERDVALKVLPEAVAADADRLHRFNGEAKLVAGLNHPNIVTLHSVEEADGVHFIIMELVEGSTLDQVIPSGGLPIDRLFELAIPMTDAVATAHEAGITHRDLKPANVMVTRDGRIKVLDFGLARLDVAADTSPDAPTAAITDEGVVVGTVRYMSPEQARGEVVDARSDIFSLGAILYEMATGRRPFAGASSAELLSAILRDNPPPVTAVKDRLPHHLARIVKRCLEKDVRQRYQAALDVRNDLDGLRKELDSSPTTLEPGSGSRGLGGRRRPLVAALILLGVLAGLAVWRSYAPGSEQTAAPPAVEIDGRRTLVVLPFENLGAPEDAFFSAGMTDELTSRLASIRDLGVISRSSAQRYAGSRPTIRQLGEELGVDYVIEGTVRWAHGADGVSQVRITPTLVQVADSTQLWSGIFDRRLEDVFQIQAEIATQVLDELGLTLLAPEKAAVEERPTENFEAYEAYLKGLEYWQVPGYDEDSFEVAAELFERAAELDPQFVHPVATLVGVYGVVYFATGDGEQLEAMREALARAEELAPESPRVVLARGVWHYYGEKDYAAAYEQFSRAAEALPNDSEPVQMMALIRRRQGRLEDAIGYFERVLEMSPRDAHTCYELSRTLEAGHRFEEAEHAIVRAKVLAPDRSRMFESHAFLTLRWKGDLDAALAIVAEAPRVGEPRTEGPLQEMDWFRRDWNAIAWRAEARASAEQDDWDRLDDLLVLTYAYEKLADGPGAGRARTEAQETARRMASSFPHSFVMLLNLAEAEMLNGHHDRALAAIDRAAEVIGPDRFLAPSVDEYRALVYARAGEPERALDLLEGLLARHYDRPLTPAILRVDPIWDGLRDEPRFRHLAGET